MPQIHWDFRTDSQFSHFWHWKIMDIGWTYHLHSKVKQVHYETYSISMLHSVSYFLELLSERWHFDADHRKADIFFTDCWFSDSAVSRRSQKNGTFSFVCGGISAEDTLSFCLKALICFLGARNKPYCAIFCCQMSALCFDCVKNWPHAVCVCVCVFSPHLSAHSDGAIWNCSRSVRQQNGVFFAFQREVLTACGAGSPISGFLSSQQQKTERLF